ncbi:MAG: hypothetical protein P4N59_22505 [Negativicutes bacterium]|nr:hypothetical protein [Negativicutes bacterium]
MACSELVPQLSSYTQAKFAAADKAFIVQNIYASQTKEFQTPSLSGQARIDKYQSQTNAYLEVRSKYAKAAAHFNGWAAVVQLAVINDAKVPDDKYYYDQLGNDALSAADDFQKAADAYIAAATKHPDQQSASQDKSSASELSAIASTLLFPLLDRITAFVTQKIGVEKDKRAALHTWIEFYFIWDSWDQIAKPHPPAASPEKAGT